MKTPYDSALRAMQREVDALRSSIGEVAERLAEVETMRQAVSDAIRHESAMASLDWSLSADGYFTQARARRERLAEERRAAEARLDLLRHEAVKRYGSVRAMEGAAGEFREEANRTIATAEQARVDDFAGARFARDMRLIRVEAHRRPAR